MNRLDILTTFGTGYELIDSGNGRKLERFGTVILDRPDPQALWHKQQLSVWLEAHAQFLWADEGERWKVATNTPELWTIERNGLTFELSLHGFKHIGIFPEHAPQWDELADLGKKHAQLRMLNLFGYTGAASIAAARAGMAVTHVDASKSTIEAVRRNAALSGLPTDTLRVVCEDALRYVKRLVQRGETFEVIVMDPPAFGRGPKGEVWKIEESLHELLTFVPKLLSQDAKLVILNGYAAGYSARTFGELLAEVLPEGDITFGEVALPHSKDERLLTTGIYASWRRV